MSTTIERGEHTSTPLLWMEYTSRRATNTVVHELSTGELSIHFVPHQRRRVKLVFLFDDEAASKACEDMHADAISGTYTITETGRDTHTMRYAVVGDVSRELDPETAELWFVSVDAVEVP